MKEGLMHDLTPHGSAALTHLADATARFRMTDIRVANSGVVLGDSGFTRASLEGTGGVITQRSSGDILLQAKSGNAPVSFISRDFRGQQIAIDAVNGVGGIIINTANRPDSVGPDLIRTTPLFVGSIQIQGPLVNPTLSLDGHCNNLLAGSIRGHGKIQVRNGATVLITGTAPDGLLLDIDEHSSVRIGELKISGPMNGTLAEAHTAACRLALPLYSGN